MVVVLAICMIVATARFAHLLPQYEDEFNALLTVAADTFSRAIVHGMLAATGAGDFRGYLEG